MYAHMHVHIIRGTYLYAPTYIHVPSGLVHVHTYMWYTQGQTVEYMLARSMYIQTKLRVLAKRIPLHSTYTCIVYVRTYIRTMHVHTLTSKHARSANMTHHKANAYTPNMTR